MPVRFLPLSGTDIPNVEPGRVDVVSLEYVSFWNLDSGLAPLEGLESVSYTHLRAHET